MPLPADGAYSILLTSMTKVNTPPGPEAPVLAIRTEDEFRRALARVRELEAAHADTSEALERSALERAIAAFMEQRRVSGTDMFD